MYSKSTTFRTSWAFCPQAPLQAYLWHTLHTADWLQPARIAGPGWCSCRGCWWRHSHLHAGIATMPAVVSVPLSRSLVYRLTYTALLACTACIHKLYHYAVPLALVGQLVLKIGVWPGGKPLPHGLIAPASEPLHVHGWQIFKDIWRYIILWIVYININIVWYFKKYISNIIINVHKWILSCCLCIPWCN